jgi:phage tail-like protein
MDSLDHHPHKRPGIHRYGNIKLTKGVIANRALWDWCARLMAGNIERHNGTIHVLDDNHDKGAPKISYDFVAAWPCKWSGLKLDGKGSATLVEEIELAVDYVVRAK